MMSIRICLGSILTQLPPRDHHGKCEGRVWIDLLADDFPENRLEEIASDGQRAIQIFRSRLPRNHRNNQWNC